MFGFQPIPIETDPSGYDPPPCLETVWTAAEYAYAWDGIADGATNVGDDNTDPSSFLFWSLCSEEEPTSTPPGGWYNLTAEDLADLLGRPFSRGLPDPNCCGI